MTRFILSVYVLGMFFLVPSVAAKTLTGTTVSHTQLGQLKVGAPIPWFAAWTPTNGVFNRRKLKRVQPKLGHVIVFFATWCSECRPGLDELAQKKNSSTSLV